MMTQIKPLLDNEDYAREQERYSKIRATGAKINARLGEITLELAKVFSSRVDRNLDEAVTHVLAGGEPEDAPNGITSLTLERDKFRRRLEIYNIARHQKKEELDRIREARSLEAGDLMRAGHRAIVKRMIEAADALVVIGDEERAYRKQITDLGYESVLPDMNPSQPEAAAMTAPHEGRFEYRRWRARAEDYDK